MLLPIRTDSPLRHTPYANMLIIVVNVLVFAVQQIDPPLFAHATLSPRHPVLFQFFTYQFMHAGAMHIIGNMLFLYIFGNNVNDKMGNFAYGAFYIAGGVIAGISYVLTQQTAAPVLARAGAVAAVTGAYLILFPRSNITIIYFFFFIGQIELQSLWFIGLFFAQDVFLNAAHEQGVAHMAHIGGTLFGAGLCLLLLIPQLLPRDQFDVWALLQRWNKRRQYRDLVSKGYNPFNHTTVAPSARRIPDAVQEKVMAMRGQIADAIAKRNLPETTDLYLELKKLDAEQVLSRQAQLDVATQLHHDGKYPEAAQAYEPLLKAYPNVDRVEQVQLMLGLIYARHLNRDDLARQCLTKAIARLHPSKQLDLAKEELAHVELRLAATTK